MKRVFAMFCFLMAVLPLSYGRAGGGVSIGRSAPSISYSRPSPSFSRPAPSYSSVPSTPRPYVVPSNTTVVNNGSSGGGFGSSFAGGMTGAVVGNMLSNHSTTTLTHTAPAQVVQSDGTVIQATPSGAVIVQEPGNGWAWLWFLLFAALAGLIVWAIWRNKKEIAMDEFDPLDFFYKMQQASMNDDIEALNKLCTRGMANILSGHPETDRIAKNTLTGVSYWEDGYGSIRFTFMDNGAQVKESWQMSNGKLHGITVL